MKKLIFILGLLISMISQGQIYYQNLGTKNISLSAKVPGSLYVDSALFLPVLPASVYIPRLTRVGALFYKASDSSIYTWTGNQLLKVQGGGGGGTTNLGVSNTSNSITITNDNGTGATFPIANGSIAGGVNAVDYQRWNSKLSNVNLSLARTPTTVQVLSSAGTPADIA